MTTPARAPTADRPDPPAPPAAQDRGDLRDPPAVLDDGGRSTGPASAPTSRRTAEAGLTPAVNMDTGYVNLLDEATRDEVLDATRDVLGGGPFLAGAFVADRPGAPFDRDAYLRRIEADRRRAAGRRSIFQSYGLTGQGDDRVVAAYAEIGRRLRPVHRLRAGRRCSPRSGGSTRSRSTGACLEIPACVGAKHSSLRREPDGAG